MNLKQIEEEALHPSEKDEPFAEFPFSVISAQMGIHRPRETRHYRPPSPLAGEGRGEGGGERTLDSRLLPAGMMGRRREGQGGDGEGGEETE